MRSRHLNLFAVPGILLTLSINAGTLSPNNSTQVHQVYTIDARNSFGPTTTGVSPPRISSSRGTQSYAEGNIAASQSALRN